MKKRFWRQSIQKKMIFSGLIITIIPLLVLELLFVSLYARRSANSILELSEAHADTLEGRYKAEISKLERLSETLEDFTPLDNYLSSSYSSQSEALRYYAQNVHPMLRSCNNVYGDIVVRIYHEKEAIGNFSFYVNNNWSYFVRQLFPDGTDLEPKTGWLRSNIRYFTFQSCYSYYSAVSSKTYPYEDLYGISVHASEQFFYEPIAEEALDGKLVLILSPDGHILSASDRDLAGSMVDDLIPEGNELLKTIPDRQQIEINGDKYYAFSRTANPLRIVYLAEKAWIADAHNDAVAIILFVGIILMALASILMVMVLRTTTQNINKLKNKMLNINRERIRSLAGNQIGFGTEDEIEQLDLVFSGMMREIDELIERTVQQEDKLKDIDIARQQAEIQALQHQIDPHYLFNTLETIRLKLVIKGNREDAEIVKLFADSFRRYVSIGDEFVPLVEEVSFVQKYIRIQNYRLNNKIHFLYINNDNVLNYKVPKLILQPLIENAVCHGVESKAESGTVVLRFEIHLATLEIFVEDDGIGMTKEDLGSLCAKIYSNTEERAVGLKNIYRRIRLIYGERANMTIESCVGIGTSVQLSLPLDALEEKDATGFIGG